MRERVQAFFNELRPWLAPTLAKKPGYMGDPVADMKTADDGTFLVKFSPDGELFFHAWLRRRCYNPVLYGRKN
jgi:antibiotic biosynthesis monooxygenase (ABM) superfamily enzyme